MQNKYQMLWANCLAIIKDNVTEQQYRTWFEPISFESFSEEKRTLVLRVPSPYVCEYLEQYYVSLLSCSPPWQ